MILNYVSGLKCIIDAYKDVNTKALFYVSRIFFKVIPPNLNYINESINGTDDINESEKQATLSYIKPNGETKTSVLGQVVDLSFPRTRALLKELEYECHIIAIGDNKNRKYKLA